MREHPVPQQISSYEFRLVGDMTIKQFFQVAGGVVVSLIIYALPLHGFLKWPFVIFFAAFGAALAFLPINDRPLSAWVFAFFKAIYSPTHYTWVHNGAEDVFRGGAQEAPIISTQGEQKAQEYLNTVPQATEAGAIEEAERSFLSRVTHLFQQAGPAGGQVSTVNTTPAATPLASQAAYIVQEVSPAPLAKAAPAAPAEAVKAMPLDSIRVAGDANFTVAPAAPEASVGSPDYMPQSVTPMFTPQDGAPGTQAVAATFTADAAPPSPATIPNTIVGQVLQSTGKVVDGAILEIRDAGGRPVRAIRSNKVGHFITVTPLKDGEYELDTEKEGLTFDVVRFSAKGEIIPPILIKARN